MNEYFGKDKFMREGLPTEQFVSEKLNVSPNYLTTILKTLTGQSIKLKLTFLHWNSGNRLTNYKI